MVLQENESEKHDGDLPFGMSLVLRRIASDIRELQPGPSSHQGRAHLGQVLRESPFTDHPYALGPSVIKSCTLKEGERKGKGGGHRSTGG